MLVILTTYPRSSAVGLVSDIIWKSCYANRFDGSQTLVPFNTSVAALPVLLNTIFDIAAQILPLILGHNAGLGRVAIKYVNAISIF